VLIFIHPGLLKQSDLFGLHNPRPNIDQCSAGLANLTLEARDLRSKSLCLCGKLYAFMPCS
jgi:hypothetical protein